MLFAENIFGYKNAFAKGTISLKNCLCKHFAGPLQISE
jgi:hypothetical protein